MQIVEKEMSPKIKYFGWFVCFFLLSSQFGELKSEEKELYVIGT